MSILTKLASLILSLITVESFMTHPMFFLRKSYISTPNNSLKLLRLDFQKISTSLSTTDKYFLIHSLINHIVLRKSDLLFDYCYKNLNYTNVAHITMSADLEYVIKKHYHNKTTLELYDTISENAKLTDCYMNIHTL
jgi:hypothetical protein